MDDQNENGEGRFGGICTWSPKWDSEWSLKMSMHAQTLQA